MIRKSVFRSWGQILLGKSPVLAIEVTNKCPLSCPGCYAFHPGHVSGRSLESVSDYSGDELVEGILELLDRRQPLAVFLVGGEPLVRVKELSVLLPEIDRRGIKAEVVTSAVIPIPITWKQLGGVTVVVSVDGLQPEHDLRRKPATYERILRNIEGRRVIIHCTITSRMAERENSLARFVEFWEAVEGVTSIRFSLYTPQAGESSDEILTGAQRARTIAELERLSADHPKIRMNKEMVHAYLNPPMEPSSCIFARVTECLSADLKTRIEPCQLGGTPDCSQCGCVAAVACQAIGSYRLPGGLSLGSLFRASSFLGGSCKRILGSS